MGGKISFVIPVYNAGRYLLRCLDSVAGQTLRDLEIIVIDDCSTDDSFEVLAAHAGRDARFRLIRFERNRGPGAARNAGLEAATGEFVRMVDADDYLPADGTEKMLRAAEQYGSHFVRGGFEICSASGDILGKGWNYPSELIVNASIATERRLWGFDQHWGFLYRTQSLRTSGARYDESMRNGQDAAFLVDLMPHLERVTLLPETVYYYRENPASIMRRRRSRQFYLNVISLYARTYDRLGVIGAREAADYILYQALCHYLPDKILSSVPGNLNRQEGIEVFSALGELLTEHEAKKLCFDRPYAWQRNRPMPWRARYLVLLLTGGYPADAYSDLKQMSGAGKRERRLQEAIADCRRQLQHIHSSASWKATAPLRLLGKMINRGGGR